MTLQCSFKRNRGALFLFLLTISYFLTICPWSHVKANAQELSGHSDNSNENSKAYKLESITVTTEKREENIQEVPAAVTAMTEMDLEDAVIENVDDIISLVPNMAIKRSHQGFSDMNIRGINSSMFIQKNPVVIYVDGVPLDCRVSYDADLVNVERVEILRGPQGTLYGKNAIGGIINVISKKPGNTYEAKVFGELGENETYRLKGYVNGPVVRDKLFFGLSGDYYETQGFMENDNPNQDYFDGEEARKAKALFRWLPTDRLEVNLHARIDQRRDGGGPLIGSDTVRYNEYRDPGDKSHIDNISSGLNISYSGDFADFKSVTTYSDVEFDYLLNRSFLDSGYLDATSITDYSTFSQELRIQSPNREKGLKWLGGLYYSKEDQNHTDCADVYDTMAWYGYNTKYNWPGATEAETMAAFGQLTIPIVAKLDLTAGARYEKTEKKLDYRYEESRTDTGERLAYNAYTVDDDWDTLLPKGVLSWTMTPDAVIYGSVTKGYLAGGLNAYGNDPDNVKFNEQTSMNYEVGAKTAWFDDRLFFNSTIFYIDIDDMHVWSVPSPGVWIASNAAKAHSQGIEIEAKARPLHGLDITAAIGWIQAEFDEYTKQSIDYSGKNLINTPAYTLNLAVQYRHTSGVFLRGEMQGYGRTYYDEANTVSRDAFELYNAKIGYESTNWDVYLYGNNLFDKEYLDTIYASGDNSLYKVGEPRKIGIIVSLRF